MRCEFAQLLTDHLARSGISQTALSRALGLKNSAPVSLWASDSEPMPLEHLESVIKFLGIVNPEDRDYFREQAGLRALLAQKRLATVIGPLLEEHNALSAAFVSLFEFASTKRGFEPDEGIVELARAIRKKLDR